MQVCVFVCVCVASITHAEVYLDPAGLALVRATGQNAKGGGRKKLGWHCTSLPPSLSPSLLSSSKPGLSQEEPAPGKVGKREEGHC